MSKRSLLVRFFEKVRISDPDGCFEWTGSMQDGGYGEVFVGEPHSRRKIRAHRYAWELANGPIPHGRVVMHLCNNPACVRPSHLALGTQAQNLRQMAEQGRARHSKLGFPRGVSRSGIHGERYAARIWVNGHTKHLGAFATPEEAAAVVLRETERLHGGEL